MTCPAGTLAVAFDGTNPEALAWARDRAAELVVGIDEDARAALRAIMLRAFEEGLPPDRQARLIRDVVGLTERDALAVMRYQLEELAGGRPAAEAARLAGEYADDLLATRAMAIARTETMRASNEGQLQLWRQAVGSGLISGGMQKEWIVTDDDTTCEECLAAEDDGPVDVGEDFPTGDPPLHPNCRCTVGLTSEPAQFEEQEERRMSAEAILKLAEAVGELAKRPVVVNVPPAEVTVHVQPAPVEVKVEAAVPRIVVEAQPAPVVHNHVEVPTRVRVVERDAKGRITKVRDE